MKNHSLRFYKPTLLIPFVLIIGSIGGMIAGILMEGLLDWFEVEVAISTGLFITGAIWVINEYLWKYKPFKWLLWVEDFSGTYEGWLVYSFVNESGESYTGKLKQVRTISQTGSCIAINTVTYKEDDSESSRSRSTDVVVKKLDDGSFQLTYTYQNEGDSTRNFSEHRGTEVLRIQKSDKKTTLSGFYYTNRIPQTQGKLEDFERTGSETVRH